MLHLTPGTNGTSIIAALPPFEEANRTRALLATILRDLNTRGFTTALPDLPGQSESVVATEDARLADWRNAFAAAALALPGCVHAVTLRAGALVDIDAEVASRWMLSPQGGAALARELERLRQLGDGLAAGNKLADDLIAELNGAEPAITGPIRTLRLASEPQPADRTIDAAPLWRRAEPDNDPALAALLADDIAEWIATCGA
ncbi:MAG: hypothetical protein V4659_02555 [Pseudomonadota bacterium]